MKVVFISNFMNHHQLPFSLEMVNLTNNQYTFIATKAIPNERLKLGYGDMNHRYPFVFNAYESKENEKEAMKLSYEAEIVILGSGSDKYIKKRLRDNKLTFRYHERLYKVGNKKQNFIRDKISSWIHFGRFRKFPYYMLCASAYTAEDCFRFHNFVDRTYKWGYFPIVKENDMNVIFELKRKKVYPEILWCGRLIDWKHPEEAIKLAEELKKGGYKFKLNIIGTGEMENFIKKMIFMKNLEDSINFLGPMSPEEVRKHMELADIFLFTSDFNEGWGAVLNEAMNSGCAVVASHAIGSVPFLIRDGQNGMIYENGKSEQITHKVMQLLENSNYREELGNNAYKTLKNEWTPSEAAKRLMILVYQLMKNEETIYVSGPCSKADRLSNKWFITEETTN